MDDKIFVGRLALNQRKLFFEYDASFIESGLNLSPFKLPLKSGVIAGDNFTFDGFFGVFNDSLPDGWGRLLLDRALIKHNINPGSVLSVTIFATYRSSYAFFVIDKLSSYLSLSMKNESLNCKFHGTFL